MKKYVLLLGLLIQAVSVLAQETSVGKSIFSVHAGPSWYLGKMIGITNNSDAYRNDLRNGIDDGPRPRSPDPERLPRRGLHAGGYVPPQ